MTRVKIYFGTDLIKLHPRQPPGGRSTDTSDCPVGKASYALRSVDGLVAKPKDKGMHVGIYAERLLGGPLPKLDASPTLCPSDLFSPTSRR